MLMKSIMDIKAAYREIKDCYYVKKTSFIFTIFLFSTSFNGVDNLLSLRICCKLLRKSYVIFVAL